jgi:hypothetical protein
MRYITNLFARYQLLDAVIRVAKDNPSLQSALFDAVSAHAPYRQVIQQSFQPEIIWSILRAWVRRK